MQNSIKFVILSAEFCITFELYFCFHIKEKAKEILAFRFKTYKDEDLKRQLTKLNKLGYAILSSQKFKQINDALNSMQSNYAKVRICSYKNQTKCDLQLEPGILLFLIITNSSTKSLST